MKIGIVGAGYWGKNLIRNFSELGALQCICENDLSRAGELAEEYSVPHYRTVEEMLDKEPEIAVGIATPAATHFRVTQKALEADRHVFVEKPLALSISEAEILIRTAEQRKRILMIGHLLQYHRGFRELKEMTVNGLLGKIDYIYSNRLNFGKIRREENILWSFAPHDISMILSLTEEEPETVTAVGHNYLSKAVADITTTHLVFPSGIGAHIFVSWLHPFKEQKLVVVGEDKMAVFDDTRPWEEKLLVYPHRINWKHGLPVPDKKNAEPVPLEETEPLKEECSHFLRAIETGTQPLTDGNEGLRVLKVLDAAQRSMEYRTGPAEPAPGKPYFSHPTAVIDDNVSIGRKTRIWHFSHILSGSKIGDSCTLGQNVCAGPDAVIGNNVKIQNNVSVYKGVEIEDDVFCGPSMVFTNVINPRSFISRKHEFKKTILRKGASVGANAVIVCGTTVGKYALVGAGAVVTRNVPDYGLVYGNPAVLRGWVCACGEKLTFKEKKAVCASCKEEYRKKGDRITPVSQ